MEEIMSKKEEIVKRRIRQRYYKARSDYKKKWEKFRRMARGNKYTKKYKRLKIPKVILDYSAIIEHLKPFPKDISKYHIDHKIPVSNFNLSKEKEILIAFSPENHRWLLIEKNLKKNNKIDKRLRLLGRK